MKKAVLMSFIILLLSAAMVFAQSDQQAVASNEDDVSVENQQRSQKVSKINKVVIKGNIQKDQAKTAVRYDEKGGIIVPNASKGIKIKPITPRQHKMLDRVVDAKNGKMTTGKASVSKAGTRASERNSSSVERVQRSGKKQSVKSAKDKRKQ